MNKKYSILVTAVLLSILIIGSDSPQQSPSLFERTPSSETYKNPDGTFTKTLYSGTRFIDDESGDTPNYVPFNEVVNMSFNKNNGALIYSYNTDRRNYWIEAKIGFILSITENACNNQGWKWFDVGQGYCGVWTNKAYDFMQQNNITKDILITDNKYSYKYGINLTSIPSNYQDKIEYIALRFENVSGITWDDISKEGQNIIIKNKLKLSYGDLLENGYTLNVYDKKTVLIGNVSNKEDLWLDPTVQLQDANVENLEDTWIKDGDTTQNGDDDTMSTGYLSSSSHDSIIKFNTSSIPSGAKITLANLSTYAIDVGSNTNTTIYLFYNQSWNENEVFNETHRSSLNINTTHTEYVFFNRSLSHHWIHYDVTGLLNENRNNNYSNFSLLINASDTTIERHNINTKEKASESFRPYLNITYSIVSTYLKTPTDNYTTNQLSNTFVCNATTIYDLDNATLSIWNSSGSLIFTNTTNVSGTANSSSIGGNVSYDDSYEWNCEFYDNETSYASASSNYTLIVETNFPAINLNYPSDNTYFNSGLNIYFNFTATDVNGLDTCELWGEWNGTWHKNYTWTAPNNATMNYTVVNLSEGGLWDWNVWCNDTVNNEGFGLNRTITVDLTDPFINITSPSNGSTETTSSVTIKYIYTETNIDTCKWSKNQGKSNTSLTCGENITDTFSEGLNNVTIYITDKASNENSSIVFFTVDLPIGGGSPGGGIGVIIEGIEQTQNFTITTTNLQSLLDISLAKDSSRPRKKEFVITNKAREEITVDIYCQSTGDFDMCKYVEISNTSFTLSPNEQEKSRGFIKVYTPENSSFYDEYYFNIIAIKNDTAQVLYSKLSVQTRVTPLATLFYRWGFLPIFTQQSIIDGQTEIKYPSYPTSILGLVFSFISFTAILLTFRRFNYGTAGLFVGLLSIVIVYPLAVILLP